MITSIVAAVLIFAILIVVHESGHFIVAKRLGVRVTRFSIGYPPRIFGFRHGETDYSIGATPFGGYVKMLGDEVSEEPSIESVKAYLKEVELDLVCAAKAAGYLKRSGNLPDSEHKSLAERILSGFRNPRRAENDQLLSVLAGELVSPTTESAQVGRSLQVLGRELTDEEALLLREVEKAGTVKLAIESLAEARPSRLLERYRARAFPSQKLLKRIAIVSAGPISNILFAPLLMIVIFLTGLPTALPVLGTVKKDLPGFAAGLHEGDRIIKIDGKPIDTWDQLSETVKASNGKMLDLEVRRPVDKGASIITLDVHVMPKQVAEKTVYGNKSPMWVIGVTPRGDVINRRSPPLEAVTGGIAETWQMTETLFVGFGKLFAGSTPVRQALGGPIMIAQMAGREARQGFADVAFFTVMLSLELGIINLLPVPLLDGGHLAFFVIEGIRGRPLQLRHRELAMQVGLFLLAILIAFVILNDISRLIG